MVTRTAELDEPKMSFFSNKKNRLYFSIALLCLIAVVCAIGIHLAAGAQVSTDGNAATESPENSAASDALSGRLVVVDPGHGGFDPGAMSSDGTREDELNLQVANHVKADLESYGAQVIMTRSDENAVAGTKDEDMAVRRRIITESQSDIVLSVHMNSFTDENVSGPLVLYMEGSSRGEKLASHIQSSLIEHLKPAQENEARADDLFILRSGNQPSVIIECGYLSNKQEILELKTADYQQRLADAICQGVIEYFSSNQE
jgi:N-acetylmuramoyl-L-alanine amidase